MRRLTYCSNIHPGPSWADVRHNLESHALGVKRALASSEIFPLGLWLRGELRPLIEDTVDTSRLAEAGIFRREEMRRLVDEHLGGKIDHNYRLWMLFNLELWYQRYIDRQSVGELEAWVARSKKAGRPAGAVGSAV